MSLKKKLGVTFIFMHGVFALVGSVAGLYYRARLAQSANSLFYQTASMICLTVENDMTIVSSSMHPCATYLRKTKGPSRFLTSLRSRLLGSSSAKSEDDTIDSSSSKSSSFQEVQTIQKDRRASSRPIIVFTRSLS